MRSREGRAGTRQPRDLLSPRHQLVGQAAAAGRHHGQRIRGALPASRDQLSQELPAGWGVGIIQHRQAVERPVHRAAPRERRVQVGEESRPQQPRRLAPVLIPVPPLGHLVEVDEHVKQTAPEPAVLVPVPVLAGAEDELAAAPGGSQRAEHQLRPDPPEQVHRGLGNHRRIAAQHAESGPDDVAERLLQPSRDVLPVL